MLAGKIIQVKLKCRMDDMSLAFRIRRALQSSDAFLPVSIAGDDEQEPGIVEATWIANMKFGLPFTVTTVNYLEENMS